MSAHLWPERADQPRVPLPEPPHWTALARCAEVGDDLWFPEKGGSIRDAKRICRGCEVRADCLEYALARDEPFGVWGGKSETERRRILRDRARSAQPGPRRMCRRNVHVMDAANTSDTGRCRACGGSKADDGRFATERPETAEVAA